MELILEKATELGASIIRPVVTARVVSRLNDGQRKERRKRWQKIVLSAARQCGTCWIPEVAPIEDFAKAMLHVGSLDVVLMGALTVEARPLRHVLAGVRRRSPRSVGLLVGPEGDLSPSEVERAVGAGAVPVSLGPRVLRVETAALFGMSVLAYELGIG
jgi:16S rRNA (uracil1498-N3)-methyltransferase